MTGGARAGADVVLRVPGAGMGCGSMGAGAAPWNAWAGCSMHGSGGCARRQQQRMPMASSLAIRSISSACSSSSGSDEQTVSMSVGRDDGVVGTVLA